MIRIFVLLALLLVSCAAPTAIPAATAKATPVPTRPVALPTATPVPVPATIKDLPAYLESFLPPDAKGSVEIMEGDHISAMFAYNEEWMPEVKARDFARDFVFAAYGMGLLVKQVQLVVTQRDNRIGLSITLGANVAASEPTSTWRDRAIGPTVFFDWMRRKAIVGAGKSGADRAYIEGPWTK